MTDILERLAACMAGTVSPEDRDAITLEACAEITRLRLTDAERELLRECEKDYREAACNMDEHQRHGEAACLLRRSIAIGSLLARCAIGSASGDRAIP